MKQLIDAYIESLKVPNLLATKIREEFDKLSLLQKLTELCQGPGRSGVYDNILSEDESYTGTSGSLYDDFYWDRRETKSLSSVILFTLTRLDTVVGGETPEQLAMLILKGLDSPNRTTRDRCSVVIDMVEKGIGQATHDW